MAKSKDFDLLEYELKTEEEAQKIQEKNTINSIFFYNDKKQF